MNRWKSGCAVLALVGSGLTLTAAPAQAAKPCYVGEWRLTAQTGSSLGHDPNQAIRMSWHGGAGSWMNLTSTTASFGFKKAKSEYRTENWGGHQRKGYTAFWGRLDVKVKVSKGVLTRLGRTATGNATYMRTWTAPKAWWPRQTMSWAVREGFKELPLPAKVRISCAGSRLVLTEKWSKVVEGHRYTWNQVLTYKRR